MRHTWLLVTTSVILAACGCSGRSAVKAEGEDATEFARTTKQLVLNFVRAANETPKSTPGQAEALLERLQVYTSRPVGENGPIYEQLTQKCKEVMDAAKRSPGSAEVKKKLEEMQNLANKLPD